MDQPQYSSTWNRFWHAPVRAERLALMRILFGVALLAQQFIEYLPNMAEFYGPEGVAPAGLLDRTQLDYWYWPMLIFNADDLPTLYTVLGVWIAVAFAFTIGFCTRTMNVALWLLTMCFCVRNYMLLDGGDDTMQICIFLLMLSPSGRALSVDAWLRRRRGLDPPGPVYTVAWPVRLIQIQLCVIYCTTGLVKLEGTNGLVKPDDVEWFTGTWWDGTSIHYVLNYLTMARYSYTSLPLPFWLTKIMTYVTVFWEVTFPLLVSCRWTRWPALVMGIMFHIGIWLTLAIGWFGFYMIALYGVWVPDEFWTKWWDKKALR